MDKAMNTLIKESFKSIDLYPMNDKLKEMCKVPEGQYQPPFTGYMGDYAQKMVEEVNEQGDTVIYNEIVRQIAVDVDKDEMIRALNYDRDQYHKGYRDGYNEARNEFRKIGKWIDSKEIDSTRESSTYKCTVCCETFKHKSIFCPNCGALNDMESYAHRYDYDEEEDD